VLPQLARAKAALPAGDGWAYEQKWDGFRTIAFVDGDEVHLSRATGSR
jgi:ATP-dependent DNA ligase